ncbi:unnamed protein product, partial [Rotaria sp. Silwood2]
MASKKPDTYLPRNSDISAEAPTRNIGSSYSSTNNDIVTCAPELSFNMPADSSSQMCSYPVMAFGLDRLKDPKIPQLFKHLMSLPPMDKNGSMSGKCDFETTQMEKFLSQAFGFQNIPGQYIVQGVKAFRLAQSLRSMDPKMIIQFPSKTSTESFA